MMLNRNKNTKQIKYNLMNKSMKGFITLCSCFLIIASCILQPLTAAAATNSSVDSTAITASNTDQTGELHAFYPANAVFTGQIQKYIDDLDSVSFAWSRIDAADPASLNTVKGKNGNTSFYYPNDYLQAVEYAKSAGKSIQLNIYMDSIDSKELLPDADKNTAMIQAILNTLQTDITQGEGIYYDGIVIDFEGLCNTDGNGTPILYDKKPISTYFTQFLTDLKAQLTSIGKKLYVAVNPGLYFDGYDYGEILDVADRVILMAHDYEPTEKLRKDQVEQYTGYEALVPISSPAPLPLIRQALSEMQSAASDASELSKVWLQIAFDSAQWQFDVSSAAGWENLSASSLSRKGRTSPLYKSIKARVDNTDGYGQNITYGYNNELQSPYIQYYNTSDKSWNVILYEDSNSLTAKINLAKGYGLGGISLWSLANVPDYNDTQGKKYHLNGWATILDDMNSFDKQPADSSKYVSFTDKTVEQAVRDKLGKNSGKISVTDLKSIYRLKLPLGTKSLKDLKNLTNLEYLDAQQLGMKAVTDLSSLTNLKVLYLQRNTISDISTLKKLTKLEVLSLNGNKITSISSLSSLTKLKELYLRENKIVSVTPLSKITGLEVLEMGVNSIKTIDALKNLKNLRQLSLDSNLISNITGLKAMTKLKSLDLSINKITDIQALTSLTGLETLYLQRNSISSIKALSGLKKLKLMSLNGNKITDLKPLTKLTLLEKLYLKDNKIKSITALKGLTNLKELYLAGNQISDYSPVKKLYSKSGFLCDFKIK